MRREHHMFYLPARLLHWLMALMILAMLFIGIGMVSSVSQRHDWLLRIHKPLGLAILILAVVRLSVRLRHRPPALPAALPAPQKVAAYASHWLLYALMLTLPLVGWAMLSAGGYPVMLSDSWRLPPVFPVDATAFAILRHLHTWLAMLLFVTILAHMAAALSHGLIRRDGVLSSMTFATQSEPPRQSREPAAAAAESQSSSRSDLSEPPAPVAGVDCTLPAEPHSNGQAPD